ncbi:zinc-binding dehydrogenase [Cnuibacter physcomitrellae]|uniref:zinc-binding dehydrogenase n=1 Tax=Cnuibacter physcomitrellae TaxID=1619308 RepID=UPI002175A549|nr:zinc-binding dehydrogenase [Cnuibacter physcomitrellae]MCS5498318.1 zinc-binding dehydrogenase [Cnuibacter physcomitrellae]
MVNATIAVLPPGTHELVLKEIDLPEPGPFEVLVEQISFGVCHSQLDRIFDPTRPDAMLLGHESIARVLAVGESVDYVRPGDQVFTTWIPRTPELGRPPIPSTLTFPDGTVAKTHNTFTWGTHSLIDEQWVVKVPDGGADPDLGSIIGCALMTGAGAVMNSAALKPGQSVAVWGVGGVGLCSIRAASVLGAETIVAVDVNDEKLALAIEFGATHGVNARTTDAVAEIRALTPHSDGTAGVDVGIDCTGIGANIPTSLAAVRPGVSGAGTRGGTDVLVGIPRKPFELDSFDLLRGEKSLAGSVGGSTQPERDFATFVDWSRQGLFDAGRLVTDRYALDEINDAVDALHHGRVTGRAVVDMTGAGSRAR